LSNSLAACNSRYLTEGVQFRLLPVTVSPSPDAAHARNAIAYQCFGRPATSVPGFLGEALGTASAVQYGIDSLVPNGRLTPNDVPLALIGWDRNGGVGFIDRWSVRRAVAAPAATGPWAYFTADRRIGEAVAMMLQFQEQIAELAATAVNLPAVVAEENFTFLPPLGLLPVIGAGSPRGFAPAGFFGAHASGDVALLDAAELRALVAESFRHEPVRLSGAGKLQLYLLWESVRAAETALGSQLIMVFATPTLPYRGTARFGYAKWNLSRRTFSII
jgi:hypothetical protein